MRLVLILIIFCCSIASGQVGQIRGSNLQCTAGGAVPRTVTISWPVGTIAGDFGVIIAGEVPAGTITPPVGWAALNTFGRNSFNGQSYTKVLNSADITAGFTTFSSTLDNSMCVGLVMIKQNAGVVRTSNSSASGASPASMSLAGGMTGDLAIYYSSTVNPYNAPTMSSGTLLQSAGYASMYASTTSIAGNTATWGNGSGNSGVFGLLVENAGTLAGQVSRMIGFQ